MTLQSFLLDTLSLFHDIILLHLCSVTSELVMENSGPFWQWRVELMVNVSHGQMEKRKQENRVMDRLFQLFSAGSEPIYHSRLWGFSWEHQATNVADMPTLVTCTQGWMIWALGIEVSSQKWEITQPPFNKPGKKTTLLLTGCAIGSYWVFVLRYCCITTTKLDILKSS